MAHFKVRNEYFRAAQRHLAVCKELRKQIEGIGDENELLKYQLLCDLYYLTGYVIECSCSAVIFHYLSTTMLTHKRQIDTQIPFNSRYPKVFWSRQDNDTTNFGVADGKHRLTNFLKATIRNCFGDRVLKNIPLLNGKSDLFQQKNCKNLLTFYEAEVRYAVLEDGMYKLSKEHFDKVTGSITKEQVEINIDNCFNFLEAAEEINTRALKHCLPLNTIL